MPRYSSPQRVNSGPQNDLIEKEAQADSLNNSMPDLLSMGNSAIQDILSGGGPVEIPLWNGKQNMSLVIGSDQKNEDLHENDQSQNPEDPNISEIDTSSRKKENPDISLIDPKGDEKEIRSESEAQEVVEKAEDHAENPEEGQPGELGQADKDMKKIRELDFEPVRMKENKLNMEVGFRSTLTQLLGVTVGKILGTVFNLGLLPFTGGIIAKDFIKSWFKRGKLQKKRNHKQIPGWDGEKFEKSEPQNNDEINVDLRKVPAVWSYPIASKAAEPDPAGDQNDPRQREKPLDPVVSVMVDQPKEGSAETFNGTEMGHTLLGIEYSRFSKITNRYERYMIKYGFYPAGGFGGMSAGMMMVSRDAVVPGQLYNDYNHKYTISRRFPAKPAQVNAIFRASETYADKGYGFFSRNCTTFVKDMVQNVGHITKLAPAIFQQDAVQFTAFHNLGMFGAKAVHLNAKAGLENTLIDMGQREDLTYENFGNKRATQRDFRNYQKSLDHDITIQKYTEIPAMVGENLRRVSGEHAGDIGSYQYSGNMPKDENGNEIETLVTIANACGDEASEVKHVIREIIEEVGREQLTPELSAIIADLMLSGESLRVLDRKTDAYCAKNGIERGPKTELEALTADDLRECRAELDGDISRVIQLQRIFKNDERLHMPIVHLISLLNYGNRGVDFLYQNIRRGRNNPGELGNIREDMRFDNFKVSAGGKTAEFSPTEYEAYLQVYKTPKAAVEKMARKKELEEKAESDEDLTKAEQKEIDKFVLMERTIQAFINAHDYMLEKENFRQEDIDYAFRLQKKEVAGVRSSAFIAGQTSSSIYQSLIYEKVFSGMKERFLAQERYRNVTEMTPEVTDSLKRWFDDDLSKCAAGKFENLLRILGGIDEAMEDPTEDGLREELKDSMANAWFGRIFNVNGNTNGYGFVYMMLPLVFAEIMEDPGSKFRKIVDKQIHLLMINDAKKNRAR
ncbi:MAG: hypothetical protein IKP86_12950 [Anaerolineaceae bacterium]|nr:hypothetical protein [Anaerolineaceae bacterium]